MEEQTVVDFDINTIKLLESIYTQDIEKRLKKFAWADKLFEDDGTRKFTIVFARGVNLEFRIEISSQIRMVICGLSVIPGGQAKLVDIDTIQRTISALQRAIKSIQQYELSFNRQTIIDSKRIHSSYELSDQLQVIPDEDTDVIKTEITIRYIVKDIITGNVVDITGVNEPSGAVKFNARAKLFMLREQDEQENPSSL